MQFFCYRCLKLFNNFYSAVNVGDIDQTFQCFSTFVRWNLMLKYVCVTYGYCIEKHWSVMRTVKLLMLLSHFHFKLPFILLHRYWKEVFACSATYCFQPFITLKRFIFNRRAMLSVKLLFAGFCCLVSLRHCSDAALRDGKCKLILICNLTFALLLLLDQKIIFTC